MRLRSSVESFVVIKRKVTKVVVRSLLFFLLDPDISNLLQMYPYFYLATVYLFFFCILSNYYMGECVLLIGYDFLRVLYALY